MSKSANRDFTLCKYSKKKCLSIFILITHKYEQKNKAYKIRLNLINRYDMMINFRY